MKRLQNFICINTAVIILLVIISCSSSNQLNKVNLSEQFSGSVNQFNPQIIIYHPLRDSSYVYYNIPEKNLLFINDGQSFIARVKLKYSLFTSYNSAAIIDSGSKTIELNSFNSVEMISGYFSIPVKTGVSLVLKLVIRDLNRNAEIVRIINLDKTSTGEYQNYLLTDTNFTPLFRNFVMQNEIFQLIPKDTFPSLFQVRCYFRRYPMAAPPFKIIADPIYEYAADSIFTLNVNELSRLSLHRYGIYHFQRDTLVKSGFTIFCFDPDFPAITHAEQLVDPTRYLTTRKEFKDLVTTENKRDAIDRFWLNLGGNKETTRTLIREYYNRVQDANTYFTSYTEGWKTDRGMIYIIFGYPQAVYRNDKTEEWIYQPGVSFPDITFTFRKTGNPFSDNDYSLIRQPIFENIWYVAVEKWRQGRMLND